MNGISSFGEWWSKHSDNPNERFKHFRSLPRSEKRKLQQSFFDERWDDLFYQNEIDGILDKIKQRTSIDLLFLRIRILKDDKFIVSKNLWDGIEDEFVFYYGYYDLDIIFGGISKKSCSNDFYLLYKEN